MKIVCITGGIGSGKTVVSKIFKSLGIPIYYADEAAHTIYEKYPEVTTRVASEISEEVVDKSGKIIKKKLSEIIFSDAEKLKILNSIVHPVVKSDFEKWLSEHKGFPYVIKEAAILFESGTHKGCDKIITVVAPTELKIDRIRNRDHKSKADIEMIMKNQMEDEERISKSDFTITNDENQLIIPQVLKIHALLIR